MLVSLKWLCDYVDIEIKSENDVKKLCHDLTNIGLEVDSIKFLSDKFKDIVSAEILEKRAHPDANNLSLCQVSTGDQIYGVVCGATNHKKGDKVVFAKIGAWVYIDEPEKKFKLKKTKIRGEASEGMLCSFEELCLEGDSSGIIILPEATPLGIDASQALGCDDVIIDIELTTNRGDCLSHLGIAREVAAIYNKRVKYPSWIVNESKNDKSIYDSLDILQVNNEVCPRYMARLVRDVKIAPSPSWLVQKLKSIGIRSINNIVDITNFVLYEYGQPLHAFDFSEIKNGKEKNKKEIIVRKAVSSEKFTTLDGAERTLTGEDILICDGQRAVALGGVMGGMNSEIAGKTRDVLIESAIFEPLNIRKTVKRLDLQTDSSSRFEKKVDPYATHIALDRAAELMREIAEGKIAPGFIDKKSFNPENKKEIKIDFNSVNSFLGVTIEISKMKGYLESLGFCVSINENLLVAQVPTWRNDVNMPVDLIEEIARLYGYNNIPNTLPMFNENFFVEESPFKEIELLKDSMSAFGFSEVINYAFYEKEFENQTNYEILKGEKKGFSVVIANPLTEDFHVLRRSLLSGLLKTAMYNLNRGNKDLKVFEIGSTFASLTDKTPCIVDILEKKRLAALVMGEDVAAQANDYNYSLKPRVFDYFDIKGPLDKIFKNLKVKYEKLEENSLFHPGFSAKIVVDEKDAGVIGKLSPEVSSKLGLSKNIFVFEIDLEVLFQYTNCSRKYKVPSKYPAVSRDLALIVNKNVTAQDLISVIEGMKIKIIDSVKVFDVFSGKNLKETEKSVGLHMVYQSYDKTLTDNEIEKIEKRVLANLSESFQAALRPS